MRQAVNILSTLLLAALPLGAQSGSHDIFGINCRGTGDKPGTPCISVNTVYQAEAIALFSGNQYAIEAKTGSKPVQMPANTTFFRVYDSPSQARIAPASIAQLGTKVKGYRKK